MMKDMQVFTNRVRNKSNIATFILVAYLSYTLALWHKSPGIDKLINSLILLFIFAVNIRFYTIYLNACSLNNTPACLNKYNLLRQNYYRQLRLTLWMSIGMLAAKLWLS